MERYLNSFEAFKSTLDWTWDLITFDPMVHQLFWGLIFVSLVV